MPAENAADSPLTALVKRLQEALGRAEEFDVLTALPSGGDSRSNPATMLARQLKMRLVASDNSGIPRTVANVVVSIHAIATFSSFNDYLRPRVASALAAEERSKAGSPGPGTSSAPSSRLSGMLAAFAAATGMPPPDAEGSGSAVASLANALSASAPPSTSRPTVAVSGRRRSSRLSAKNSLAAAPAAESESASSSGPSSLPNAPSP
jgi:E3 ubiquitin-protein ligase TRIP12